MVKPNHQPTIAYIRNELRNNRYIGDTFEALEFLLAQFDEVYSLLKFYTKPVEFDVVNSQEENSPQAELFV